MLQGFFFAGTAVFELLHPEFEIDCECMARRGNGRQPDASDGSIYHGAMHYPFEEEPQTRYASLRYPLDSISFYANSKVYDFFEEEYSRGKIFRPCGELT